VRRSVSDTNLGSVNSRNFVEEFGAGPHKFSIRISDLWA
jgi:hypothetical protein